MMKHALRLVALAAMALIVPASVVRAQTAQVLIVLLDDVGPDLLASTPTPTLDSIRDQSARFEVWTYPVCSPTRAALMTGQYGFRTGIGAILTHLDTEGGLDPDTLTIADMVSPMKSVLCGKWHLAAPLTDYGHPLACGWDFYAGSINNLGAGGSTGYFNWIKTVDSTPHSWTTYATTDTIDDAIRALGVMNGRLVMLSANAAHAPMHSPPPSLHSQSLPLVTDLQKVRAALEALDTELERAVDMLGAEDYLILSMDNGTATHVAVDPERAKGSLYQGGIAMPLWISGPGIEAGDRVGLVDIVDVGLTAVDLLGETVPSGLDGQSIVPSLVDCCTPTGRAYSYSERFDADASPAFRERAIRDAQYKLIRRDGASDEFYDLAADPGELAPLDPSGPAWSDLSSALTALSGT